MNRFRNLKTILICFCFVSGCLSVSIFLEAVLSKPNSGIRIQHIRTPRSINESSEELFDSKIPDEVYRDIQNYRSYMDSIGEPIRPGLADSMKYLEEMYLQQQK